MTYEEFKAAFLYALRESHLPTIHGDDVAEEWLDLHSTDRRVKVYVEPLGGQDVEPFHVTAELSWRWESLHTARSRSCEEDVLVELLGREDAEDLQTEPPWLRVDIILRASLPYGEKRPMPAPATWRKWVREAMGRLERIERVVPDDMVEERDGGLLAVLAWQGELEVRAACGLDGELLFESVRLASWQSITLPRKLNNSDSEDEPPDVQLAAMFQRVRAALHAWMEVMDHLA